MCVSLLVAVICNRYISESNTEDISFPERESKTVWKNYVLKSLICESRDCSVGRATSYEMKNPRAQPLSGGGGRNFLDRPNLLPGPPRHLYSGCGFFFLRVKRPERRADHATTSNAGIKEGYSFTSSCPRWLTDMFVIFTFRLSSKKIRMCSTCRMHGEIILAHTIWI